MAIENREDNCNAIKINCYAMKCAFAVSFFFYSQGVFENASILYIDHDATLLDKRQKATGEFVKIRGDSSKLLQFLKKAFNHMLFPINFT